MKWISVEDGLPDRPGWFLMRYLDLSYDHRPANWEKIWFFGQLWDMDHPSAEITHWMHIEEPKDD